MKTNFYLPRRSRPCLSRRTNKTCYFAALPLYLSLSLQRGSKLITPISLLIIRPFVPSTAC